MKAYKELKISTADSRYMGKPPKLSKNITNIELVKVYNWYNYFYEPGMWKSWVLTYVGEQERYRNLEKVPEKRFINVYGVNAKLLMDGEALPKSIVDTFHKNLDDLVKTKQEKVVIKQEENKATKIPKKSTIVADIEDELDIFYNNNYSSEFNLYKYLVKIQCSKSDAILIYNYYKPIYEDVLKYPQDYTRTKSQYKQYLAFLKMLVENSEQYVTNKVKTRKPRKRKEVDTTKLLAKVNFKKNNVDLQLVSISPDNLVGTKTCILYNDKYRYVIVLNAKDVNGLSIKGTTILNYDEKTSFLKTVRKPENLSSLLNGGLKIILNNINALSGKSRPVPSGRINSDTLILKGFK